MKRKIRINVVWAVCNLLTDLNNTIRKRYEEDFLELARNEEDLLFFKERSQDLIPF